MTNEEREALKALVVAVGFESSYWDSNSTYDAWDASAAGSAANDDSDAHARLYDAVQRVPREQWPASIAAAMAAVDRARASSQAPAPRFKVGDRVEIRPGGPHLGDCWIRGTVTHADGECLDGRYDEPYPMGVSAWTIEGAADPELIRPLVETPAQPETLPAPTSLVPDYPATCPRCHGPATAGLHEVWCEREGGCRPVAVPEPRVTEIVGSYEGGCRTGRPGCEQFYEVSSSGIEIIHPIRDEAVRLWREAWAKKHGGRL